MSEYFYLLSHHIAIFDPLTILQLAQSCLKSFIALYLEHCARLMYNHYNFEKRGGGG